MSRLTAIMILVLVTFLTVGAAVALAEVVTPDDSGTGGEDSSQTCPMEGVEGVEAMKEHHGAMHGDGVGSEEMRQYHESMHGEGSWENMPGPGASAEEMQEHHESIHGEGSWEDAPCNTDDAETTAL